MMGLHEVVICCALVLHFSLCVAASGGFALKPEDVKVHFPHAAKTIYQVCMPRNANSSVVWLRGNDKLRNTDRVSMTHVSNVKKLSIEEAKLRVKEARSIFKEGTKPKIHILSIKNPEAKDSGEYACSVITRGTAPVFAKFQVEVSDDCRSGEYMCATDKKCLKEAQLCDGISDCSDSFDESEQSGCGQPVVPENLRMESESSSFIDAIKLRWDKVVAATSYELVVSDMEDNEIADVIVSNAYPGREIGGLTDGTEYSFKVRSKTRSGFGKFSESKVFSTLTLGPPGPVLNLEVDWPNDNLTDFVVSWDQPADFSNHLRSTITYSLEYCQLVVVPDEEETNNATETAEVTPVKNKIPVLNVRNRRENAVDAANETTPAPERNATAEVEGDDDDDDDDDDEEEKPKVKVIVYEKEKCKTVALGSALTKTLDINVTKETLYSFEVTTIGSKNIKGASASKRYVVMPPTVYTPGATEFTHFANDGISGVLIFGIVTGALVVVVLLAFIVAYACKWSIVQDDMNLVEEVDEDEDDLPDQKYEKLPTIQQQYDSYEPDSK